MSHLAIQRSPNGWSCLPAAFATAMGQPVDRLIKKIGHDGSAISWPDLPEPLCRRGFHVQECIWAAYRSGYLVTPVEVFPRHAPTHLTPPLTILLRTEQDNWHRIATLVDAGSGVLTGKKINDGCSHGHAVAYCEGLVFDSNGATYQYSRDNCETHHFYLQCLWMVHQL